QSCRPQAITNCVSKNLRNCRTERAPLFNAGSRLWRPVMRRLHSILTLVCLLVLASHVRAGVGDPTLETDHPQYSGEGAFQTIEQCVARASAGKTEPQDKAIALYLWMLTHQYHLMSPQEWNLPGSVPDTK